MLTVLELLTIGRNRIEEPDHWCKGNYACNAEGYRVVSDAPEAVSFCMFGALRPEGMGLYRVNDSAQDYLNLAAAALYNAGNAVCFNDLPETTHEQVLAVYDKAIELAQAEAA